ncbi:hypothetical protein CHF27_008395 [Romboutsia maritimum]|uniref:Lipoprotein n=1 Tax=Romboutsia maritimum TaxID=2020948 RepID=A0A371ISB9_9FIRM|nr:hypothetical protein [Romboutsia maritimum]RDY23374.1 hypothetical protein CHF27_008395 [Romboutsia maritimum]
MKLKESLVSIIVLSMFITGCNIENTKKEDVIADKATQQKTMTKVQNDVNEIMNKDYNYVVKNMGVPYCTTYYISADSIKKDIDTIEKLNKVTNIRLVYPKYTSDNKMEKSALYIEINKNKVTEVENYDFSTRDINKESYNKNIDIIIDKYDEKEKINLKDIKNIDLEKFKDEDKEKIKKIVGNKNPNLEAYTKNKDEAYIMSYLLKDENKNESKVLTIFIYRNKIKEVKILDREKSINAIKNYLLK